MLDDFKPNKPASPARISRPQAAQPEPDLDVEIGDAFAPPDQVAAQETSDDDVIAIDEDELQAATKNIKSEPPEKPESKKPKKPWWPPKVWTKKRWLLVIGILIVLLGSSAAAWYFTRPAKPVAAPVQKKKVEPEKPKTVASPLSGVQVSPELAALPVTGIMVENSQEARPQSGLDQAGVVYEAIAEGGITRFLALFQENQADYVGPVRSSRPYYLRWLLPFDAAYAHVGGSPDALSDIKTLGVKDMDQFYNAGAYQRVSSRAAPHNVYTSLTQLLALEKTKKYDKSTFTSFPRKQDEPNKTPNATSVDLTISGPLYSVHYDYDPLTNSYKRSEGGAPHMVISKLGAPSQLTPKVVIALVIPESQGALDASNAHYTEYDTIGSGQMYVFQDGVVTQGSWSKSDNKSQFVFTDSIGKPLPLNAGQTWISVVGLSGDVVYK